MSDRSGYSPLDEFRHQIRRPRLLILFGWFLILSGALTPFELIHIDELASRFPLSQSRLPEGVHHLAIAVGGAIRVACGIGLLSGYEWARLVWLIFSFAMAGLDVFAFPATARMLIPTLVLPALSVYLLFRPAVNDYFVAVSSQNYPDLR